MPWPDILLVFQWWGTLFLVGAAAYPLTRALFTNMGSDLKKGQTPYFFSKAVGLAVVTFLVFLGAILHLISFTQGAVWASMGVVFVIGIFMNRGTKGPKGDKGIILQEIFFFVALLAWTWVKAHEPSIHGLEKFMDFGFTKSILDSRFFPAPDMWYAGTTINYYYFGHTMMAVLTKLSGIDLTYTFNLMLATIFALCATMSFAIGRELTKNLPAGKAGVWGGILTAFLVTLAGNMQTIYAFTIGYDGENVKPFWQLLGKMDLNRYWYANATRFIPYTIHEFPSYSFVVSDLHGHVLSIPFVLLAIGLLIAMFSTIKSYKNFQFSIFNFQLVFYGFLCGVLLMTNALDGPIYLGLLVVILGISNFQFPIFKWKTFGKQVSVVIGAAALTSLPFLLHFKSFVNGIAVNCPPAFLANTKLGPILFEGVEKCQHSPFWMWWLLWGFFVFCGIWGIWGIREMREKKILVVFFFFSLALLIFPEFFYFKDIYPMHFRSNTMFKLGYQAFIMLSIVSGYTIVKLFRKKLFLLLLIPQLFLISIFPIFSVRSYFNSLRTYESIFGMNWFILQYPDDWAGIVWLNQHAKNSPVIVEADGDSYTDYDRFSAFTGLPTIIGWPVHEWLWRGTYDVVAPRREEVRKIYESQDLEETKNILKKYSVTYVIVGTLERQKFQNIQEKKIAALGSAVFTQGETVIYKVH